VPDLPVALLDLDPSHATDVIVNHKSQWERDIALVGCFTQKVFSRNLSPFFNQTPELGNILGVTDEDLKKTLLLALIVHHAALLHLFDPKNGMALLLVVHLYLLAQLDSKILNLKLIKHPLFDDMYVKVRDKVVNMSSH
jgi:hypothetical protein